MSVERIARGSISPRTGLIVAWGIGGVLLLLFQAIMRLTPLALEPIATGMSGFEWSLFIGWAVFNAYAEGYRGFHLRFAPRVVARAFHLAYNPRPLHVLLGPAYCMSLVYASRRGLTVAWTLLIGITSLVLVVRLVPQPWRGIIDVGVVVGLAIGSASVLMHLVSAFQKGAPRPSDLPPAIPESAE